MPAFSGGATILMLIPVVAIGINHYMTARGKHHLLQHSPTLRFTFAGAAGFSVTCVCGAFLAFFSGTTSFTIAEDGFNMVALYSFFTMMMFGAIYFILPRVVGCEWLSRRMIQLHFWPSVYGSIFITIWLIAGGIWEGISLQAWSSDTINATGTSNTFLIGKTALWVLFVGPSITIFVFHFLMMLLRLGPAYERAHAAWQSRRISHSWPRSC